MFDAISMYNKSVYMGNILQHYELVVIINSTSETLVFASSAPVNNVEGMQISQRTRHFSYVEFCSGLGKGPLFLKMEEKLKQKGWVGLFGWINVTRQQYFSILLSYMSGHAIEERVWFPTLTEKL